MNDVLDDSGSVGGGSAASGFLSEVIVDIHSIFEVGREKINDEEVWMHVELQSGSGMLNFLTDEKHLGVDHYGDPAYAIKKVKEFHDSHCFDALKFESVIDDVVKANKLLEEHHGPMRTKITSGLASWEEKESHTAKAFKDNYVTSIDEVFRNQGIAIDHYYRALLTAAGIGEANRQLLRKLVQDVSKEMNDYSPFWGVTAPFLAWTLDLGVLLVPEAVPVKNGLAFASKKVVEGVAGQLVGSAKKSMKYEESVANIVQGLLDGIDELEKNSKEACDALSEIVKKYISDDTAESNIFACPRY